MEDLGLVGGARRQKMREIMDKNTNLLQEARSRGEDVNAVKLIPIPEDLTYAREIAPNGPASADQIMSRFYDEMISKPRVEPTGDKKADREKLAQLVKQAKAKFVADAASGKVDMPEGESGPSLGTGYFHANGDDVADDLTYGNDTVL